MPKKLANILNIVVKTLNNGEKLQNCLQGISRAGDDMCVENWGRLNRHFMQRFYSCRSQMRKKTDGLTTFFCAFGICASKSFLYNVDEVDP